LCSIQTSSTIFPFSLPDALPIYLLSEVLDSTLDRLRRGIAQGAEGTAFDVPGDLEEQIYVTLLAHAGFEPVHDLLHPVRALSARDRKSTRLNSSHVSISYAVFCF